MEKAQYPEPMKAIAELAAKYTKTITRSIPIKIPQLDLQTATPIQLANYLQELRRLENYKIKQVEGLEADLKLEKITSQSYQFKLQIAAKTDQKQMMRWARRFIDQYKGNEQNPMFYNPSGLSPMEMQLMRYQTSPANNELICMICFDGFLERDYIIRLPCNHILHSECGMTRLLYTKECPACNEVINFEAPIKK